MTATETHISMACASGWHLTKAGKPTTGDKERACPGKVQLATRKVRCDCRCHRRGAPPAKTTNGYRPPPNACHL